MSRRLRQLREAKGLTVVKLGAISDVHPSRVSQIENGRATPPGDGVELARLAKALKFKGDPARLLDEVSDEVKA